MASHSSACRTAPAHSYSFPRSGPPHIFYNISHQNLRVVDVADTFQRLNTNLKIAQVQTQDPDRRNYRVSAERMLDEGFRTRTDVMEGAEGIAEAIASGAISDPESVFYRNAKWLKDLTTIGSMDHRQLGHPDGKFQRSPARGTAA